MFWRKPFNWKVSGKRSFLICPFLGYSIFANFVQKADASVWRVGPAFLLFSYFDDCIWTYKYNLVIPCTRNQRLVITSTISKGVHVPWFIDSCWTGRLMSIFQFLWLGAIASCLCSVCLPMKWSQWHALGIFSFHMGRKILTMRGSSKHTDNKSIEFSQEAEIMRFRQRKYMGMRSNSGNNPRAT